MSTQSFELIQAELTNLAPLDTHLNLDLIAQEIQQNNFSLELNCFFVFHQKPHIFCKTDAYTQLLFDFWLHRLKNSCWIHRPQNIHYRREVIPEIIQAINAESMQFFYAILDVKNYFYSVIHQKLIQGIQAQSGDELLVMGLSRLLEIIDQTLQGEVDFKQTKNIHPGRGLILGHELFFLLASLYLTPLDMFILNHTQTQRYYRYIDDILLGTTSPAYTLLPEIEKELNLLGLKFNQSKIKFANLGSSFTFLRTEFTN